MQHYTLFDTDVPKVVILFNKFRVVKPKSTHILIYCIYMIPYHLIMLFYIQWFNEFRLEMFVLKFLVRVV